ncbi:hypothetical protein [Methylobacterium sp. ID0610]|uniref:hypothetical protein n=1 Tax=Methylobacterium carpenticola TaxID=3344827 RepID=UPI00367D9485
MDDLDSYRLLTAEEIVLGLAAIGAAVARHAAPGREIRAVLTPDGIRLEGRGTGEPRNLLIPFRELRRRPGYLLAREAARFAAHL